MADDQRQFWNAYWKNPSPTLTTRTTTQILLRTNLEYLQSILPPAGRSLEVGCGSAQLSCLLATSGYQTVCFDPSAPALQAARTNYSVAGVPGSFVLGDGFRLPFADGSFDVVLSSGLLEHFEDPSPIVREMVRVLQLGGVFYSDIAPRKFSLFRSLDWVGKLKRAVTGEYLETFYERPFTSRQILELLGASGLADAQVFAAGVVPPYLPLMYRSRRLREGQVRLIERTKGFWKRFDRTRVAEWLGFYYFAWATRPSLDGLESRRPSRSA